MSKIAVIYHRVGFDGEYCRQLAKTFLPDADLIGWDFGDMPIPQSFANIIFILGLPVDKVLGLKFSTTLTESVETALALQRVIWIDSDKESIESHPLNLIRHYCIEGVATWRLVEKYFMNCPHPRLDLLPEKEYYDLRPVKVSV